MELEGIMLNEISQRKTNTVLTHKYNLKKKKTKPKNLTKLIEKEICGEKRYGMGVGN